MSPETVQSFLTLAIGFALAGLLSSGYQAATSRPASFRLLAGGPHPTVFAAVPFLVFAAPFIIMRNTLRRRYIEGWRFWVVMSATMVAGFWSLMSGTLAVSLLMELGLIGM
jgi:nicotinamide riboside transporter PnuC